MSKFLGLIAWLNNTFLNRERTKGKMASRIKSYSSLLSRKHYIIGRSSDLLPFCWPSRLFISDSGKGVTKGIGAYSCGYSFEFSSNSLLNPKYWVPITGTKIVEK